MHGGNLSSRSPLVLLMLAVLDGKVVSKCIQGPMEETLYHAVLDGLKGVGLEMKESVRRGSSMKVRLSNGLHSTGFNTR